MLISIFTHQCIREIEENTVAGGEERETEDAAATRKLRSPERRRVETERLESLSIFATSRKNLAREHDGGLSKLGFSMVFILYGQMRSFWMRRVISVLTIS